MTHKLPRCALCGQSLARKARAILTWGKPGRPSVGWCLDCEWGTKDPEWHRLKPLGDAGPSDPDVLDDVLATIARRGEGRVVRGTYGWFR